MLMAAVLGLRPMHIHTLGHLSLTPSHPPPHTHPLGHMRHPLWHMHTQKRCAVEASRAVAVVSGEFLAVGAWNCHYL